MADTDSIPPELLSSQKRAWYDQYMFWFIPRIRRIIYACSFFLAAGMYYVVTATITGEQAQTAQLIRIFAFTSALFLYFTLLASPLYSAFPSFPFRPVYIKARQALGVSAFAFGLMHASIVFFKVFGGLAGFQFWDFRGWIAVSAGLGTLLIFIVLAATSPGIIMQKLGIWWKPLHRLVYLAGVLVLIHAVMFGTDFFSDLSGVIARVALLMLCVLLVLEAFRFKKYFSEKFSGARGWGLAISFIAIAALLFAVYAAATFHRS